MGFETRFLPKIRRSNRYKEYALICYRFAQYLDRTEGKTFELNGFDTLSCKHSHKEIPYVHRFCEVYQKALYAKFSRLEEWYKENETPVFLLTLTTAQTGDIKAAFEQLRAGWEKITANLRKIRNSRNIKIEYLYVYEHHKSGYPHMHVIIFGDITDAEFDRLKRLWSDKYEIGSYEHGLNVSKSKKEDKISHVRAYILKYVQKSMDFKSMTVGRFVFLAVMWSFYDPSKWVWRVPDGVTATGTPKFKSSGGGVFRLWGASRALTGLMKYQPKEIDATKTFEQYARFGEDVPEIIVEWSKKQLKRLVSSFAELKPPELKVFYELGDFYGSD
ncbi:MAG TPA: hypothetical protein O0X39_04190 [Methanocorpusculum sp.]|nr:hypothetical protein [Methanocorpusculum sp.]